MKAFPFGVPPVAGIAVTASTAATASFLATLVPVPTASVALNILGPQGPSGSNVTVVGTQGPQGPQGPTGPQGFGIYLVTSSLAVCCEVSTTYECVGDTSVRYVADGTHDASGCVVDVDSINCSATNQTCEPNATRCSGEPS